MMKTERKILTIKIIMNHRRYIIILTIPHQNFHILHQTETMNIHIHIIKEKTTNTKVLVV